MLLRVKSCGNATFYTFINGILERDDIVFLLGGRFHDRFVIKRFPSYFMYICAKIHKLKVWVVFIIKLL